MFDAPDSLGAVSPGPLEELETEICELAAHIAAATCRWLLLLAEWDERRGWAEWGVRSCADWLSWRCSIGPGTAREHIRVAKRLTELPLVRAAFATGELSYSKVRAITRVADQATEEQLVMLGQHASGSQLEQVVQGFRKALAVSADAEQAAQDSRFLRWYWDDDGSLRLQARIPAAEGALLLRAIELNEAAYEPPDDPRAQEEQPRHELAEVRRADALVATARSALEHGSAARPGGDPCEMVVHVDVETLAEDADRGRCEIEAGPALAPETMRRLGCDAAVVGIIEKDGTPLGVGRRTRTIPPALRRALRSRDGGCRFPGCDSHRFLHAHHIQHWARGGSTDLENLVQLCSHHHRLVHEGGYSVERVGPRSFRFRRPNGQVIPDSHPGMRARGADLAMQHQSAGLTIDDATCRAKSAGQRLDRHMAVDGLVWLEEQDP